MVKSIRQLSPLERGGVENRQGIDYQDYVAAKLYLEMIQGSDLLELWCETHDDITLIWNKGENEFAEFIQVKKTMKQWSVSMLCRKEKSTHIDKSGQIKTKTSNSILEKSLANDRCEDSMPIFFRLITGGQVNADLEPLTLSFDDEQRSNGNAKFQMLCDKVEKMSNNFKSKNNNGSRFWLERTAWQITGSIENIRYECLTRIDSIAYGAAMTLNPEQKMQVLINLLRTLFEAGASDETPKKRFLKNDAFKWIQDQIEKASQISVEPPQSSWLKEKMSDADILSSYQFADNSRRGFREWRMVGKYMPISDSSVLVGEVESVLQRLIIDLDRNTLTGKDFHELCLKELKTLAEKYDIPQNVIDGCMYDIAGRCGHRWKAK